ncbi:autotransporter-associated beta strand repeat-containing protein, partial [Xanthobacter sp. V0B-10]|uniref:autotransporter-associated beta strand repeat-containing protein n=1 Tax=Xanthobacter albus TaxID=3119929 RepID=UPI0037296B11
GHTFAGKFSGSGALIKTGASTLTLTGDSSAFTGATIITAGTLALSGGASIENSNGITVDGKLDIADTTTGATIRTLQGGSMGEIALGARDLTVDQTADHSFAGRFSGSGALIKTGASTLTLTGNSSGFAGSTIITAGTLALSGGAS